MSHTDLPQNDRAGTPENHYNAQHYQRTVEIESRSSDAMPIEERYKREAGFALDVAAQDGLVLSPNDKILDLACGIGGHADVMREKTGAHIEARDIADYAITQAQERESKRREISGDVRGAVNFAVGDMVELTKSLPHGAQYKLVTILGSSFLIGTRKEEYTKAVRDIFELTAPGGRFVIQWRQRKNRGDPAVRAEWGKTLGVGLYERKAEGPEGHFGKSAKAGEEVIVIEDTQKRDGFYFFDEVDSPRDEEGLRTLHFRRAYFDAKGNEEAFRAAHFIDYLDREAFVPLKKMLEEAGFKNVHMEESAPLTPDGNRVMYAVVARKDAL